MNLGAFLKQLIQKTRSTRQSGSTEHIGTNIRYLEAKDLKHQRAWNDGLNVLRHFHFLPAGAQSEMLWSVCQTRNHPKRRESLTISFNPARVVIPGIRAAP